MPLSIFTTAKPFKGTTALLQRNALRSWKELPDSTDIHIIGDDDGSAEMARSIGASHHPDVKKSSSGAPLISDLFRIGKTLSENRTPAYLNADIITLPDFENAIQLAESLQAEGKSFLLTACRHDLLVEKEIDFTDSSWSAELRKDLDAGGALDAETALDLFIFSPDLYTEIPDFAIGRTAWDNWLLTQAHQSGALIIDMTPCVTLVHQAHDYSHVQGGWQAAWHGDEAQRNKSLAGSSLTQLSRATTHTLTPQGLSSGYQNARYDPRRLAAGRVNLAKSLHSQGHHEAAWSTCLESLSLSGLVFVNTTRLMALPPFIRIKSKFEQCPTESISLAILTADFEKALAEWVQSENKSIIIWGAGAYGQTFCKHLEKAGARIMCYIDKDPLKHGKSIGGVSVADPRSLLGGESTDLTVLVASMYRSSIESELQSMGLKPNTNYL